jgi:hypothetical protein
MKTPEDEAFDELAKKQGMWGGGFTAKRQAAMDKVNAEFNEEYIKYRTAFPKGYIAPQQEPVKHWSDCAVHNAPAYPAGECDCGVEKEQEEDWGALAEKQLASIKRDTQASLEDAMVRATHKVMAEFEAQPAQESEMLTIAYQSGYHDGKKAALAGREWNFCERCGKRTKDMFTIHTCTPPQEGK